MKYKRIPLLNQEQLDRLYNYIDVKGEDECWNWLRGTTSFGHPVFVPRARKLVYAHRLMYYYFVDNTFNQDLCVLHKCDNPKCCNPKHLMIGTLADNVHDKVNKGRQSFGDSNAHVLSQIQVDEIRRLWNTGNYYQSQIAKMYKIDQSQVSRIVNGYRWRHSHTSVVA